MDGEQLERLYIPISNGMKFYNRNSIVPSYDQIGSPLTDNQNKFPEVHISKMHSRNSSRGYSIQSMHKHTNSSSIRSVSSMDIERGWGEGLKASWGKIMRNRGNINHGRMPSQHSLGGGRMREEAANRMAAYERGPLEGDPHRYTRKSNSRGWPFSYNRGSMH